MAYPKGNRPYLVYLGPVFSSEGQPGNTALPNNNFTLTTWLEPTFESVVANGEIGELRCLGAKHPDQVYPLSGTPLVQIGQSIKLVNFTGTSAVNDDTDPGITNGTVVFSGVVVKFRLAYTGQSETYELVAYNDADWLLHRIGLHGQLRRSYTQEQYFIANGTDAMSALSISYNPATGSATGSGGIGSGSGSGDVVTIDTPLIFNPDGEPNATAQLFFLQGANDNNNEFPIFEVPFRNQKNSYGTSLISAYWTLSNAIKYLLNIYPSTWAIDPASFGDAGLNLFSTYGDPVVSNVNCEGKTLGQALSDLLLPYNYGYWIEPGISAGAVTPIQHRIHFFYRGEGTAAALHLEPRGTQAYASIANLVGCDLTIDSTATVNAIKAYGDKLNFTTIAQSQVSGSSTSSVARNAAGVLTLVKGWRDSDLTWAFEADGQTVNPFDVTFRTNYCQPTLITPTTGTYGIGRLWLVNLGEVPDATLEDIATDLIQGGVPHNSIDPRRFEKAQLYTKNAAGGILDQEQVIVEMSTDKGQNWNIVSSEWYRVLPENLGIVFVNPKMEKLGLQLSNQSTNNGISYWQSLHDKSLQLRVIASVKSDERLKVVVPNDGLASPLATTGIMNNPGYRKFIYNPQVNSTIYYTKFPPQEVTVNDTNALSQVVDVSLDNTDHLMISGNAAVILNSFGEYAPGMAVSGIDNRINFPTAATILRVVYKFAEQQAEIVLDNKRVASVIKAKPTNMADDYRQHKLGIENPKVVTGAKQVPYIPGDDDSFKQYLREQNPDGGQ